MSKSKSKNRLKHFLILASRLGLFVSLISAFLLFSLNRESSGSSSEPTSIAIYLDNSLSSIGNSINEEINVCSDLIRNQVPSAATLLTNDFSPFSNFSRSKLELDNELNMVKTSYVSRPIEAILTRLNEHKQRNLISDFQGISDADIAKIVEDSSRTYNLFFKNNSQLSNVYVDSLWIERDLEDYSFNLVHLVLGTSSNYSNGSCVVKLLNDEGNQIASVVHDFSSRSQITFSIQRATEKLCYNISIDGDELYYDNDFYFIAPAVDRPKVLILSKEPDAYLSQVFANKGLFDLTISTLTDLAYSDVSSSDLVVVNGFRSLPTGLIGQNATKAFFVIPSDSIDLANYASEAGLNFLIFSNPEMLETELSEDNPLVSEIHGGTNSNLTALPRFSNRYQLRNTHESILVSRDGGTSLGRLIDKPIFFLSSPLSDDFTNLTKHAIFLPIMYRIAEVSVNLDLRTYYFPGESFLLPGSFGETPPRIIGANTDVVPDFSLQNGQISILVPGNLMPGAYHVIQDTDTLFSFGMNLPKAESLQPRYTFEEFSRSFEDLDHVSVYEITDEVASLDLTAEAPVSIWKYALILSLAFMITESLLHRYMK